MSFDVLFFHAMRKTALEEQISNTTRLLMLVEYAIDHWQDPDAGEQWLNKKLAAELRTTLADANKELEECLRDIAAAEAELK